MKWSSVLSRERSQQLAVEEALESIAVDLQGEAPDLIPVSYTHLTLPTILLV